MLTGIHFLLTYRCNYECDHCFIFCSPWSKGTFTLAQIRSVLAEAEKIGTVNSIFFEGGEPFLYYPIMVEGLRLAGEKGMSTGVVTNCYWATAVEDASVWLTPTIDAGLGSLSLSDDAFHSEDPAASPAKIAAKSAAELGLSAGSICIEAPTVMPPSTEKGEPVVGGGTLFKGRAAEKLTEGLPTKPSDGFTECVHEELVAPKRVHIDSFGNVMVCQGVSIGNMWQMPLSEIIGKYDATAHPICGPLSKGGPRLLAETHGVNLDGGFVDECHYCYLVRRALIDQFPEYLAPRQVYGLE
jgi:Radical SAM superfamily